MLGLLSVGLKNSRKANVQTTASNVLAGIAADIQASSRTVVSADNYLFTSPKMQIGATVTSGSVTKIETATTTTPLTVNESCTLIDPAKASVLEKLFRVDLTPAATGTTAIRVRIEWPYLRPPNSKAEGSMEALVPLPY